MLPGPNTVGALTLLLAVLVSAEFVCPPQDKNNAPLCRTRHLWPKNSSLIEGSQNFTQCTYGSAGPCTYNDETELFVGGCSNFGFVLCPETEHKAADGVVSTVHCPAKDALHGTEPRSLSHAFVMPHGLMKCNYGPDTSMSTCTYTSTAVPAFVADGCPEVITGPDISSIAKEFDTSRDVPGTCTPADSDSCSNPPSQ
ncbi:hypothetical protein BDZ89DRAFT_1087553 [Hymenopellis radicata]|nr:hypothetical protein BDZ89DRAFT_1087553 [Hymenopellis radicata]